MAPNPQLTYLDRVVMEIIETERMYVRDLRMIVEVSHMVTSQGSHFLFALRRRNISVNPANSQKTTTPNAAPECASCEDVTGTTVPLKIKASAHNFIITLLDTPGLL